MDDAVDAFLDQLRRALGQRGGEGRRGDVILHHFDRRAFRREPQHHLDEISARGIEAAGTVDARGANHQRLVEIGARIELARELRDSVSAQRTGGIVFGIGAAGKPVEDVVGGKVDQLRVDLAAGDGQVADGEAVDHERRQGLLFGDVDLVVSGGVEHNGGVVLGQRVLDLRGVGNIDLGPFKTGDLIIAGGKYRFQFDTQLSTTAKDRDSLHTSIMTREGLAATGSI